MNVGDYVIAITDDNEFTVFVVFEYHEDEQQYDLLMIQYGQEGELDDEPILNHITSPKEQMTEMCETVTLEMEELFITEIGDPQQAITDALVAGKERWQWMVDDYQRVLEARSKAS